MLPTAECPRCQCNDVSPVRGQNWPWWDVTDATEAETEQQQQFRCNHCGARFWGPAPTTAPPTSYQEPLPYSTR